MHRCGLRSRLPRNSARLNTANSTQANALSLSVGDCVARFLEAQEVAAAFGVVSIHNMPLLDAISSRGRVRFIPSRGEAGAVNMADACARVSGKLAVAFTSTGTGAGNAAGALIEALTASSPILHITGQIETNYLDRNLGYIHEAPAQLEMLKAVSKSAYRLSNPEQTVDILERATEEALTAPMGPVSIEIPIDVQRASLRVGGDFRKTEACIANAEMSDVKAAAQMLSKARRPMLLLGGGARQAEYPATQLANLGIGIVTSTHGRAIVPEEHPRSLGALNTNLHLQKLYASVDLMLIIGSRLRSNETWNYQLKMPEHLIRVDCDPLIDEGFYPARKFICADSAQFLSSLLNSLPSQLNIDNSFAEDIAHVRQNAIKDLRDDLGPYADMVDALQESMPPKSVWVRDVTISNSTWGNRLLRFTSPNNGVHALGGGIGQGLPMAIGAACAAKDAKTVLLTGDGGLSLCLGELVTAAEQNINAVMILMNDDGYGVIRNIQDAQYGGRKFYSNIFTPDFAKISQAVGTLHLVSDSVKKFRQDLKIAFDVKGFSIIEVDMNSIGPFKRQFAGPPSKH